MAQKSTKQTKTPKKQKRARSYARNRTFSRRGNEIVVEPDSIYLMKLMLVILLGGFWVKFSTPFVMGGFFLNGVPLGLVIGLFLVSKYEPFQFNRKIWYALLIITTIISYFLPLGVVL